MTLRKGGATCNIWVTALFSANRDTCSKSWSRRLSGSALRSSYERLLRWRRLFKHPNFQITDIVKSFKGTSTLKYDHRNKAGNNASKYNAGGDHEAGSQVEDAAEHGQ